MTRTVLYLGALFCFDCFARTDGSWGVICMGTEVQGIDSRNGTWEMMRRMVWSR
jgi:hypothetical protein